jgi:hypothetical protein
VSFVQMLAWLSKNSCVRRNPRVVSWLVFFGCLFLFFSFPSLMIHAFAALGWLLCCCEYPLIFLSLASVCLWSRSLALSPSRRRRARSWENERERRRQSMLNWIRFNYLLVAAPW